MKPALDTLMDRLQATRTEGWQYLEVKQMAEILARHREKARMAVREYRMHKRTQMAEHDAIEKLYLGYEAMFLRDHVRDAVRLYILVNRDFHEAQRSYLEGLKAPHGTVTAKPVIRLEGSNKPESKQNSRKKAA
ncbi:MAG: hypothetical protein KGQ41_00690 [Alphaproteobacteria bacterium]|nr:hypothetical protein [Alphaproteobacteria bacterium]